MDDTAVPPVVDFYGDNDGTCSGAACPTPTTPGLVGNALSFDGNDQVVVTDDPSLKWGAAESLTVETWVKTTQDCTGNKVLIGKHLNTGEAYWWLGCTAATGTAEFEFADSAGVGSRLSSGASVNDGSWHHIAAVISRDNNTVYLYVDGALKNSVAHAFTGSFSSTRPLQMGHYLTGYYYNGLLDEVAVYKRALSAGEIAGHYNAGLGRSYCDAYAPQIISTAVTDANEGQLYTYDVEATGNPPATYSLIDPPGGMIIDPNSGLISWTPPAADNYEITVRAANSEGDDTQSFTLHVAAPPACPADMISYWKLDESSGTAYDDYFDGNDGTASAAAPAPSADAVIGGAQSFNGTGNYITVADAPSLDWASDDSFTIAVWAKLTNCDTQNKVMIGRDNRPGGVHWWLGCGESTKTAVFNLIGTDNLGPTITGSTVINDGQWHQIVAARDESTNQNRLYVDGVFEGSASFDYAAGFDATTTLGIGYMAYTGTPDYFYDGLLDEIALYSRALPEGEIQAQYQAGLAGTDYCSIVPVLPTITSVPVTTAYLGAPYQYDVEADGYPPPTYSLTTKPTGMTIDEVTGEISWLPYNLGDFDVVVEARNAAGTDTQGFTISVGAITPCPLGMDTYWRLDEATGTSYEDSFGDSDGLCRDTGKCPTPEAGGKVSAAQEFDRAQLLGINIPVPGGGQPAPFDWGQADSFSIEFWMKKDTTVGNGGVNDNEVMVGRDDTATNLHWWFGVQNSSGQAHFQLGSKNSDTDSLVLQAGPRIDDGQWHHLVGVRDGANNINRLYVDGAEVATASHTYTADFGSATAPLNLGWLNLSLGFYYTGILDEVALYDRALSPKDIKTHYYLARGYCNGCDNPVRIMPLGDSITDGNASGVTPIDTKEYWVSYRKVLWESLGTAGYSVDFVGSLSSGYFFDPPFDSDHEGHGGWTDTQIRDNVISFLTANPADVILLHIGTNGLTASAAEVEQILDNIDTVSEDITVVLARIINQLGGGSTTTTQFNDNVEAMAEARIAAGDKIIIVDMENGAGIIYGQAPSSGDMWDNLHPYETGYAKMSGVWLNGDSTGSDGLADFLPVCAPPEPYTPTITSEPVTKARVGAPYGYDVQADGFPPPTYTLTIAPPGMVIDEITGEITWTPVDTGTVDVTVEARNMAGTDDQSYSIKVGQAPVCPADMTSYWMLDETGGSTYYDAYNGNDGVCGGVCPAPISGRVSGGQAFNGSSTGINVPADASFDWASGGSFSVEYWMKKSTACSGNEVIVGRDDTSSSLHWWTGCWDGGEASLVLIATNGNGGTTADYLYGTSTLIDNAWHHVVAVRDAATSENRLYVDGVEEAAKAISYGAGFGSATAAINIGWLNLGGGYRYEGALDEVALYGRALTAAEILEHYTLGLAGQGYCDLGPMSPEITSTPDTTAYVGTAYSYDVEATANPPATYALTAAPADMAIDADSGLITWMPAATGDFAVTVTATNSEGSDSQSFTIQVLEITPCPPGLSSYWQLDEASGTAYLDSFDGNDGTCRAVGKCPTPSADGQVRGAQTFSRPTQTGINVPGSAYNWGQNDSFTVEYWMRKSSACSGTGVSYNEVIAGRDDATSQLHWWTGVGCVQAPLGRAVFQLRDTEDNGDAIYGQTVLTNGRWHHVVAVRDGSAGQNRLYVDGRLEGSLNFAYSAGFDGAAAAGLNLGWLNLSAGYYYTGDLDEVAVYDRALTEKEIKSHYFLGRGYCETCASDVTIMPMGDSITYDNYSGDTRPAGLRTSYRSHLWWALTGADYNVDFVGSEVAGQDVVPAFDPENAGFPGIQDGQLVTLLKTGYNPHTATQVTPGRYLQSHPADVILLHIGTNALATNPDEVEDILDEIDTDDENTTVLLARIINRQGHVCPNSSTTTTFNNNVEAMAEARIAQGDKIIIVDMECGAGLNYNTDMIDTLHPTDGGYAKMADAWLNGDSHGSDGLADFLPICGPTPEPVVLYEEDWQSYAAGADPDDWFDTKANNSMVEDDSLFKVYNLSGNKVFGTTSTLDNIHSHYVGTGASGWSDYRYTGRMMMTASDGGIGVTLLSQYPNRDAYYRLRRYGSGGTFQISPHGTLISGGTTDTGVVPVANTWYRFMIEVEETGTRTEIRAKVWPEGTAAPASWQVECYDSSATRLTRGTIGLWSMDAGSKYWDDLVVSELGGGGGYLGDVNGDGVANSTDALIILSCNVGYDTSRFCPMNCGDVNGDGLVDSTDALIVMSYDVGMTVPFPVGQAGCPSSVTPCDGCTP